MQSLILHSGYGYSKLLCEDVTIWFLNKYFPKHKITVNIIHRGLKREGVLGYCDIAENSYRPREFNIELDTYMSKKQYIQTLLHELVHVKQWVTQSLKLKYGKMYYRNERTEFYDYVNQPHEIEAREQEELLYIEYTGSVFSSETTDYFPNRLMCQSSN